MNYIVTNFSKADNGKSIRMSVGEQVIYEKTLDYTGGESLYEVMIPIPAAVAKEAVTNTLNGSEMPRVQVRIESAKAGEDSASVNTEFKTVKIKTAAGTVAYFVDCGDFGTSTLSDGDAFGLFNSVTEQVYGADPVFRGMNWGIWDDSSTVTAPTPEAGKGIGTNTTWAYEMGAGDGADKTATNRYTKNQYENGWQTMKLSYKFDLPNGKYQVKVYFTDPWTCSQNPSVAANGTTLKTGCAMDEEIVLEVTVTDGELLLDFTNSRNDSNQKCINLCYIQIIFA